MEEPIKKYGAPTQFDRAPYGERWIQQTDNDEKHYVQLNIDDEHPDWRPLGHFFEKVFAGLIHDKDFMNECLRLYAFNQDKPYKRISDIIKDK